MKTISHISYFFGKVILFTFILLSVGVLSFVPVSTHSFAYAQNGQVDGSGGTGNVDGSGGTGTNNQGQNNNQNNESTLGNDEGFARLKNPLEGTVDDIPGFVQTLLNIVLMIGVPVVALAIIYSGFLFVSAQGKPEAMKKAKDTLLYTLIGAAIVLGAFVIANAIGGTINQLRG